MNLQLVINVKIVIILVWLESMLFGLEKNQNSLIKFMNFFDLKRIFFYLLELQIMFIQQQVLLTMFFKKKVKELIEFNIEKQIKALFSTGQLLVQQA